MAGYFDVFIIGAGQAAMPLCHMLADRGLTVALAERKHLGGSCVNFGCTPTKAAIASARVLHLARRASEFGLKIPSVEVDFPAVLKRARDIAAESRNGLFEDLQGKENPKLVLGHARIDGRSEEGFRVSVGDRSYVAKQIVLDVGTRSLIPEIEGLLDAEPLHASNWLFRDTLPKRLAIIGGGVIALEMAQFYRRMGSEVTVVERSPHIGGQEDADISVELQKILEVEGVRFLLGATTECVEAGKPHLLRVLRESGAETLEADDVFVATGRIPNTDELGLETVGIEIEKGYLKVDRRLSTNVAGIWAAGDVRGGPKFTHTAWDDYRILMSQLVGDGTRTTDRIVPYAVFTDPQLGRVGLTEHEARAQGKVFRVGRYDLSHNGQARETGETRGFVKVLVEEGTDRVLGAACLGANGSELVQIFVDLMNADAPFSVLRDAVIAHPTFAEAAQSAVEGMADSKA